MLFTAPRTLNKEKASMPMSQSFPLGNTSLKKVMAGKNMINANTGRYCALLSTKAGKLPEP